MFEGIGGLGLGMLGLGVAGDVFSAYSNYQQQQRMRDLYKRMQDPAYIMGQANQYYNANLANLRSALPQLERTSINPEIGMRGISGGAAQALYDQTVAGYQQQAWQQALQQAAGGLQNASQMTGYPTGQGGGTGNALQSLMLMQALQSGRNPSTTTNTDTTNLLSDGSAPSAAYLPMNAPGPGFGGGSPLNFGYGGGSNPFASNYVTGDYALRGL